MLKEKEFRDYTFRLIGEADFGQYKAACSLSPKELTEFLALGQYMDKFNVFDFWNHFSYFLNSKEMDIYGLFDEKILVGFAAMSRSPRQFGTQISYWIRNGYHGKGLGKLFMFYLLTRALGPKNFKFAELIIDQENHASLSVAEALGLTLIDSWEDAESGAGTKNSGKFRLYMAFENRFSVEAEQRGLTPYQALQELWALEALGLVTAIPYEQIPKPFKRVTLRETLRFAKKPRPEKGE